MCKPISAFRRRPCPLSRLPAHIQASRVPCRPTSATSALRSRAASRALLQAATCGFPKSLSPSPGPSAIAPVALASPMIPPCDTPPPPQRPGPRWPQAARCACRPWPKEKSAMMTATLVLSAKQQPVPNPSCSLVAGNTGTRWTCAPPYCKVNWTNEDKKGYAILSKHQPHPLEVRWPRHVTVTLASQGVLRGWRGVAWSGTGVAVTPLCAYGARRVGNKAGRGLVQETGMPPTVCCNDCCVVDFCEWCHEVSWDYRRGQRVNASIRAALAYAQSVEGNWRS